MNATADQTTTTVVYCGRRWVTLQGKNAPAMSHLWLDADGDPGYYSSTSGVIGGTHRVELSDGGGVIPSTLTYDADVPMHDDRVEWAALDHAARVEQQIDRARKRATRDALTLDDMTLAEARAFIATGGGFAGMNGAGRRARLAVILDQLEAPR